MSPLRAPLPPSHGENTHPAPQALANPRFASVLMKWNYAPAAGGAVFESISTVIMKPLVPLNS